MHACLPLQRLGSKVLKKSKTLIQVLENSETERKWSQNNCWYVIVVSDPSFWCSLPVSSFDALQHGGTVSPHCSLCTWLGHVWPWTPACFQIFDCLKMASMCTVVTTHKWRRKQIIELITNQTLFCFNELLEQTFVDTLQCDWQVLEKPKQVQVILTPGWCHTADTSKKMSQPEFRHLTGFVVDICILCILMFVLCGFSNYCANSLSSIYTNLCSLEHRPACSNLEAQVIDLTGVVLHRVTAVDLKTTVQTIRSRRLNKSARGVYLQAGIWDYCKHPII